MPTHPDYQLATVDRLLTLRARSDLEVISVAMSGQASYVLRDPLTLELVHLSDQEYFLFESLRTPTTLAQLKQRFEERFSPQTIAVEALQHAVEQFAEQGLLFGTQAGQGSVLQERESRQRHQQRLQNLLSVLSFRLVHGDATAWIDRLYCWLGWVFSPASLLAATVIVAYALGLVVTHANSMLARMPALHELTQPGMWPVWLATIAGVKVLHELGHVLTLRHFGGRCHEMGIMLLALLPCLYGDVTDAWRIPNKWHRMAVSAAGMGVELVLAAAAIIAWWYSQPGMLQTWLLGVVIICSIGTLAVNANPLLRYDGYYLLSDWLEIPNLAPRAQLVWQDRLQHWLVAESPPEDPLIDARQQRRIAQYALLSRVYCWFVLLVVLAMLLKLARPWHLENLVYTLAVIALASLVVAPLRRAWAFFRSPARRARIRRVRAGALAIALLGAVGLVFHCPIHHTVQGTVVLVPGDAVTLYATMAGRLQNAVPEGTSVSAGQVVARLSNPDVQLAQSRQAGEFAVRQAHYRQLRTLRTLGNNLSRSLPSARAEMQAAQALLIEQRRQSEALTVRAPVAGTVIAPPRVENPADDVRLPTWQGTPLDERNRHCWVEQGTAIFVIGNPERLIALVTVDEQDIAEVGPRNPVSIQLASFPGTILSGTVARVASRATRPARGEPIGELPRSHLVEVRLDDQDALALAGMCGRARIEARSTTLWSLASDFIRRRFQLPW